MVNVPYPSFIPARQTKFQSSSVPETNQAEKNRPRQTKLPHALTFRLMQDQPASRSRHSRRPALIHHYTPP